MSTPHLIKNGKVIADPWQLVAAELGSTLPQGPVLLPLALWLEQQTRLEARADLGLWLEPNDDLSQLGIDPNRFAVIAIHFPKFVDGRGYSLARLLRERYGYRGELRAVGDVLHDQLYFMARVGFDAFALRGDKNVELALNSAFKTFSDSYQGAVDQPLPLFQRRHAA